MSRPLRNPRQGYFDFLGEALPVNIIVQPSYRPALHVGQSGQPLLGPPPPVLTALVTEPEVILEPEVLAPAGPSYRELEWMLEQAASLRFPLGVFKVGRKWVSVVPYNLDAALRLENYRYSDPEFAEERHLQRRTLDAVFEPSKSCFRLNLSGDGNKLHFPLYDLVGADVKQTPLYRHLTGAGFDVWLSPSLRRFIEREARRIDRNLASLDMPEFVDDRPLYDRIETGTLLRCITPLDEYQLGTLHLVTTTNAEDEFIRLHEIKPGKNNTTAKARKWGPAEGPLEPYFEEVEKHVKIYDPATSVVARFPQLVEQNNQKLNGLRSKLFLHTAYDAAQMGVKDHAYFGKQMRMGKSAEFFAWAHLKGSKRRAFVSSKNVRQVIVKEAQRMGLAGIVVVNSLADLEKDGTYYLMTYDWLKGNGAEAGGIGRPVRDTRGSQRYAYPTQLECPHCGQLLVRPVRSLAPMNIEGLIMPEMPGIPAAFTPHFGYMCVNPECSYTPDQFPKMRRLKARKGHRMELVEGAAWSSTEVPTTRKYYIDYGRKLHWLKCVRPIFQAEEKNDDALKKMGPLFRGRMCTSCGYIAKEYSPMRYRRVNRYRWGTIAIDEIHAMKSGFGTLQGRALLALKAKHRAGLSGTLMPNAPADPYWPLHWIFGGGTHMFPYFRTGDHGLSQYVADHVASIFVYDDNDNVVAKKATPYLKNIARFHHLMASKMSRRAYGDPLVVQSLEAAGLVLPEIDYQILQVEPSEEQARLMVSAIDVFKVHFDRYRAELDAMNAGRDSDHQLQINSSRVLPLMMRLRIAATVPDLFNVQLAKQGVPAIYHGEPGGAKLPLIRDLAQAKARLGQKVVVFSFFREMQRLLGEHLGHLNPLVFDTRWDEEERADMIDLFATDPSRKVLVASPLSLGEGVDLSAARCVICADLLWVPGKMAQAWSRILKALPEPRRCEIYRILMHRSIDEHIWNVFYAKQIAQEQAFDRRIVTRRETAIDIQAFVDRVMASRTEIMALLPEDRDDEALYAPMRLAMGAADDRDDRE